MRCGSSLALCLAASLLGMASAAGGAGATAPIPADTVLRIVAHGPWPPPARPDPSNRVSGQAAAISFGRRMFHEPRLSANGYVACVACHQTDRGWTDGIARARGLAPVGRNTLAVANAALNTWFGWGGASDSLWMASLRPLLDPREMGVDAAHVARVVRIGDGLACEYRLAFGRPPEAVDDETVMVDVAKAMAAFQATLATGRTRFDDYRDAVARSDWRQAARYPAAAARGARLFVGKAGCATCHAGASFSDGSFRTVTDTGAVADGGRRDDLARLLTSRYNLAGRFNDDPDASRRRVAATRALPGQAAPQFRVPSLRNVADTAPYLHDGSRQTLREAVRHPAGVAALSAREVDALVAFLATLSDADGARRPLQRPADSSCR